MAYIKQDTEMADTYWMSLDETDPDEKFEAGLIITFNKWMLGVAANPDDHGPRTRALGVTEKLLQEISDPERDTSDTPMADGGEPDACKVLEEKGKFQAVINASNAEPEKYALH
ncbi:MAG: hypothetical protein LQ338_002215 [Usnochroma carphineum]|nr:MAG: hypothetical protein LQ338_002215 [Usnochroma carphineum]